MQTGTPKQYLPLLGRPVVLHTLIRLCGYSRLNGVLVGLAPGDDTWPALVAPQLQNRNAFLGTFDGGAVRAKTVLNGLAALASHAREHDWVMVHDAVRPCVRPSDLEKLVAAAQDCPDGALLAAPVADTVKRADVHGRVSETVSRASLWRALTPQMFRFARLRDALNAVVASGEDVTDESAAMERTGARPAIVEGHPDNIKITHPSDLALAELFLKQQADERV